MKTQKDGRDARDRRGLSGVLAALMAAAVLFIPMVSVAESFNMTNSLNAAVGCVSWPTNTPGTNGIGALTGGPISVENQEWAGFYFSCQSTTNTNTTVTLSLVRSVAASPPVVTFGTNGAMTRNDWESPSNAVPLTPILLTFTVSGTNPFTWFTNLDRAQIGGARWVGIYAATNNQAAINGSVLTNVEAGLYKKIIPIRYP
jgi:hypothetical protein